ncbi:C40 family peptidase [Kibdelosporangium lantanae]|uniref:C40 family peptidase n=1 Tax=Kibdelosporangium lantanae TaxID=1497396 RepID=A0ABW3M8T5_9PSEU
MSSDHRDDGPVAPVVEVGGDRPTYGLDHSGPRTAPSQFGKPYVWGGDGDAESGFDCSGLTRTAYQAAGITIPRTAQTQYNAGPLLSPDAPLLPGDLEFFGTGPARLPTSASPSPALT